MKDLILGLSLIAVFLAAVIGWVMNIVAIWHTDSVGPLVLRVMGVFVAPLGAVLGWI